MARRAKSEIPSGGIAGKTAVVTGGGSGIGAAIAVTLARNGARVAVCARSPGGIATVRDRIEDAGGTAFAAACDVSDEGAVRTFFAAVKDALGPVDVLVANAGFGIFKPVTDLATGDFDAMIATNLRGVFLCTKAVLPDMIGKGEGDIVFISSLAGKNGFAGGTGYCASKFAVRGFATALLHDVRDKGVRTATVFPGSVDTSFRADDSGAPPRRQRILRSTDVADAVLAVLLAPRHSLMSEIDIRPSNPR